MTTINKLNTQITPTQVNGKEYYTVRQFAYLINLSIPTVTNLIKNGNSFRKLKADYFEAFGKKPFIPVTELYTFIFTPYGRKCKDVDKGYKYCKDGYLKEVTF